MGPPLPPSLVARFRRRALLAALAVGVIIAGGVLASLQISDLAKDGGGARVSTVVSSAVGHLDALVSVGRSEAGRPLPLAASDAGLHRIVPRATDQGSDPTLQLIVLGIAMALGVAVVTVLFGRTAADLVRHQESDQEQTMFHLLDQLPVGVLVVTPDGKPWFANQSAHAMLGPPTGPTAPHNTLSSSYAVYQAGTETPYPTERAPLTRALAGEIADVSDMEIHRGDEVVPLHVYGSPIRNQRGEIAFAVATFQNVNTLHRAAHEDALTGLPNRLAATHVYNRERLRCARSDRPLAVAFLDLDRFKAINDAHGHPMGDEVLRRISAVVTRSLRKTDLVARWGGEELIVLLPETDLAAAEYTIGRTLQAVIDESFVAPDGRRFRISFSAGIVTANTDESLDAAIARADVLLYAAKRAGRSRVFADGVVSVKAAPAPAPLALSRLT